MDSIILSRWAKPECQITVTRHYKPTHQFPAFQINMDILYLSTLYVMAPSNIGYMCNLVIKKLHAFKKLKSYTAFTYGYH